MITLPLLLGWMSTVQAKDLSDSPLGIGVNTWYNSDIPALSVRYILPFSSNPNGQFHIEGLVGTSIHPSTRTQSFVAGRILSAVVIEDNLNVLAGAGVGLGWINKTSVLQFQPALETQYFLFGLDYLSFESGVGLDIVLGSGENTFQTTGKILGGFHYWF